MTWIALDISSIAVSIVIGVPDQARDHERDRRPQVSMIDISRACFLAECDLAAPTYVKLQDEHPVCASLQTNVQHSSHSRRLALPV